MSEDGASEGVSESASKRGIADRRDETERRQRGRRKFRYTCRWKMDVQIDRKTESQPAD